MAKYLFVYHGGKKPESKADQAKAMDDWGKWMGGMGSALIDGGNPVGKSSTVKSDGSVSTTVGRIRPAATRWSRRQPWKTRWPTPRNARSSPTADRSKWLKRSTCDGGAMRRMAPTACRTGEPAVG